MAIKITRPQGTEDVTPKQIYKWHTVERIARETAENFGFHETRIPTFESTDLFLRSVGETTDVVQKEMYTVKAKETEFTLRPEGTAGTIRSILQNGLLNDALPQKVYYILSCFRHERPQAGRLREFHQFGIEMAGSQGPTSDAEIIALAKTILDRAEAVETTASRDRKDPEHLHIILIIGKGNERWFKDHGKHIPYEGDDRIVERVFRLK